jgi:DeoR/GlpR family transcriptional regulator of sugar metabolism
VARRSLGRMRRELGRGRMIVFAVSDPSVGDLLVERLERDGKLVAKDLAREFGVSEDSVRRDPRELASAGLCQRVYGGAVPISPARADCRTREHVEPESKARVARRAAELIHPGDPVILDGGTTTLARRVPLGGRVYKHSAVTRHVTGS